MSEFFKSKYKMIALLMAFILVVTAVPGFLAYRRSAALRPKPAAETPTEEAPIVPLTPDKPAIEPQLPSTMRGVFITPGIDFLATDEADEQAVKAEIDSALEAAKELGINSVIINTAYEDKVIYHTTDAPKLFSSFDVMGYIVQQAKTEGFHTFGVFDLSTYQGVQEPTKVMAVGAGGRDAVFSNLGEFAAAYKLDGILLDGYTNPGDTASYEHYSKVGGAIGFENYMRETPEMLIQNAVKIIRNETPITQIGILADPVWANQAQEEEGSVTKASFSALVEGNADTRAFVQNGLVDFIAVNAYGSRQDTAVPFAEVATWWGSLAHSAGVPLYIVQAASKAETDEAGWGSAEELSAQVKSLETIPGVRGSVFDSLSSLSSTGDSATLLMKYYKDEQQVPSELMTSELKLTKPTEATFSTGEPQVVFAGASIPQEPVTINGTAIRRDASGYFAVSMPLEAGENAFTLQQGETTIDYAITRQIAIIRESTPTGIVRTDGNVHLTVTAFAYEDATVYATLGGQQVAMHTEPGTVTEENRESSYKQFTGNFIIPEASDTAQELGTIAVTANWNGESITMEGASVTINKAATTADGTPVEIVVAQAATFSAGTLNNTPSPSYYSLPLGALDYAIGDELIYQDTSYTLLASGVRVETDSLATVDSGPAENTITGIEVSVEDGFTYVKLASEQKVSYKLTINDDRAEIVLNNTTNVPEDMELTQNPLFQSARWNDNVVTLSFVKVGGFLGYHASYEGGTLVFRFTNPPATIKGARITIDPGHGGSDAGAVGFLEEYSEREINNKMAQYLADELTERGASVQLLNPSEGLTRTERVAAAEEFNAHLFISVHNNSASNLSAHGTEISYFHAFAKTLATETALEVSGSLGTQNRGAKERTYPITLSPQMPSILVEAGFVSNRGEYEKLVMPKYQQRVATGIAQGVEHGLALAYTGIDGGGAEHAGGSVAVEESKPESSKAEESAKPESSTAESSKPESETPESSEPPTAEIVPTGISLGRTTLTLTAGKTSDLKVTIEPANATNQRMSWSSSDTAIATVSDQGRITGVAAGKATITVTTTEGGHSESCQITVEAAQTSGEGISVESAELSDVEIDIAEKETYQLAVAIFPDDAANQRVIWKTSNSATATVTSGGMVTGIKVGETTITATTEDGGIVSTCYVIVVPEGENTGLDSGTGASTSADIATLKDAQYITVDSPGSTMYVGSSLTLSVYTDKDKAVSNGSMKWRSSDTSIITVDEGGVVSSKRKEGTATITAYHDKYSNLYESYTIYVTKDRVKVTEIYLNQDIIELEKGAIFDGLRVTIAPSAATNREVSWRVISTDIATVNQNGVITAKNNGSTTVVVTSRDGGYSASCKITVSKGATLNDLYLDIGLLELSIGDSETLSVTISPETSGNTGVTWRSSNSSVVSVDAKGNVKALKRGTAKITVISSVDSYFRDVCEITVE